MVRFITSLLIVSLLTLNVAWAVDECAFTDPGEPGGVSHLVDGQVPADPSNAGLDCDDWCHAWVNSVALPGSVVQDRYTPATSLGGLYIPSYSSLPIPPPFHPPIV
jgi:hypothetical protein